MKHAIPAHKNGDMMREIKFRGRSVFEANLLYPAQDKWVYGYLVYDTNGKPWIKDGSKLWGIAPGSEGQYIGLKSKDGIEIYDGNIVEAIDCLYEDQGIYLIVWDHDTCRYWGERNGSRHFALEKNEIDVLNLKTIGTFYENPGLLNPTKLLEEI